MEKKFWPYPRRLSILRERANQNMLRALIMTPIKRKILNVAICYKRYYELCNAFTTYS
jgi:hypothetical protein